MNEDFFNRGLQIGEAGQQGEDATTERARKAQEASDIHNTRTEAVRGAKLGNDETAYTQGRQHNLDSAQAAAFAANPTSGAPTAGVPMPPDAPAATDGTGLPTSVPKAPAVDPVAQRFADQQAHAQRLRQLAQAHGAYGNIKAANDAEAQADTLEQTSVREQGEAMAATGPAWESAAKMISQNSKYIQLGKDKNGRTMLSVQQPDGTTEYKALTEVDKRNIMGAAALMAKGYTTAALGTFAKVNADLATAVSVENKTTDDVAKTNIESDYKGKVGDADMMKGQAMLMKAGQDKAANREIPPELVKKSNDLLDKIAASTDEKERKHLTTLFNGVQSEIANATGKTRALPQEKEVPQAVIEKRAESLVGTPTGKTDDKGNKEMFTPEMAYNTAAAQLRGQPSGGGFTPKAGPDAIVDAAKPPPAAGLPTGPSQMQLKARAALGNTPAGRFATPDPDAEMKALNAKNGFNPYAQNRVK